MSVRALFHVNHLWGVGHFTRTAATFFSASFHHRLVALSHVNESFWHFLFAFEIEIYFLKTGLTFIILAFRKLVK